MPVKFQSDAIIQTANLAVSRLHKILLCEMSSLILRWGPGVLQSYPEARELTRSLDQHRFDIFMWDCYLISVIWGPLLSGWRSIVISNLLFFDHIIFSHNYCSVHYDMMVLHSSNINKTPIRLSNIVFHSHIDGLVQERRNSSALAMELRLSCINPSTWCLIPCHHF